MRKWIIVALLAFFALAGCARTEKPVTEGSDAPDFTLKDLSGKDVRLSALRGKLVLVNFWATWCPPCRSEIPSMAAMNRIMGVAPFQLLAISIDEGGSAPVQALFASMGVSLPTLLDPTKSVGRRYGITGVPETFIVSKEGKVVKKIIGPIQWDSPEVIQTLKGLAQ